MHISPGRACVRLSESNCDELEVVEILVKANRLSRICVITTLLMRHSYMCAFSLHCILPFMSLTFVVLAFVLFIHMRNVLKF